MPGPIYIASISSAVSTGVAKDFFEIDPSTTERVAIREIRFGQYATSQGSTGFLQVLIWRGSSAACAGGTTGTVIKRDARDRASNSLLTFSASSPSTGGDLIGATTWNMREEFVWRPNPDERAVTGLGDRINVRVAGAHETFTWSGRVVFEELGTPA